MNQNVLISVALLNERPRDTSIIIPPQEISLIQPLRDVNLSQPFLDGIPLSVVPPKDLPTKEAIQKGVSLPKGEPPIFIDKEFEISYLSFKNLEEISYNHIGDLHPFLGCSKLKNTEKITSIDQLGDQRIDYRNILLKNGISQNAPLKYTINFDLIPDIAEDSANKLQVQETFEKSQDIKYEIQQHWTIIDIVTKCPPKSWIQVFEEGYADLQRISDYILQQERMGRVIYPLKKDIFRALELTELDSVKVVIIGQDPYPGKNKNTGGPIANGLAFSSNDSKIPQSLNNIYKRLCETIEGFVMPTHSDLTCWAKQGVCLLNSCLTLEDETSNSHKQLWAEFITRIIHHIDKVNPNCVYLLWGTHAHQFGDITKSKNKLMSSHPSNQGYRFGFNVCDHFRETNEILKKLGKVPINWSVV